MYTTIIIIIIVIFLWYIEDYQPIILWKNKFEPFSLDNFKNECGYLDVDVGYYCKDGKPDLSANSITKFKLIDWFSSPELSVGNKQTKFTFFKYSNNKVSSFIKSWINSNFDYFPEKFKKRYYLEDCEYTIRISRGTWEYPSHFDATDIFTFVLSGNRNVILNKEPDSKKLRLEIVPGDILYFDCGIYHHFWCDNDFNLVLNISFKGTDKDIDNKFANAYPQRMEQIATKREYLF
jgi:hypothetical protein